MRKHPLLVVSIVIHASMLGAQATSTVAGRVVRARAGAGIPGAEVTLSPRNVRVVTDAAGEFRFESVPPGYVMLHVRRIGFAPESLGVHLPSAAPINIELRETPQRLDTVTVNLIDPGHVSAIEYYAGPSQMPAQFNRTGSSCGARLIWTK